MPKPDALPNSTDERGPSALGAFPPQHQWSDEEANRLSNPFETTSISLFVEEPTVIDDPDASVSDVAASMVEHDTDVLVLATDDGHRLITLQTIVQQVADGGEGRAGEFAREAPNVQIAASFEELLAALTDADIEAAVVVDGEGELRGVVRVSNVAKHLARAVGVPELTPALSGQPY
ncbi:hypothetical protein SAMN04487947_1369 [Halogeometricum rufum]|uniref:CBS domain-containing protein n=2 Tax=Halogeometricum rufum TaxID=553469 RepID=A0A1I6GM61_9EURY|nr:hypothetical protein SAMN04487947_1369 [Halogeometricum rufum]